MYQRAAEFLLRHQSICIASHFSPDGDAIGSTLALGMALIELGKRVTLFNQDNVPANLRFLPFSDRIAKSYGDAAQLDALVLVDCAQPKRAGDAIEALAKRLPPFMIDHHILPGIDHAQHCIDAKAAATGEVVYHLLRTMNCRVTPEIANLIYCTLVTDTGRFRYSNTTAAVFHLAGDLVKLGADPWNVASNLTEQNHPSALALLRLVLATLQFEAHGRYASVVLTQEMLQETEALPEYAEEFVGYPRSIAGVEVAVLFRELPDKRWKASLRSKSFVDVAAIAALFDGGGHEHAAGCTFTSGLMDARQRLGEIIHRELARRPGVRHTAAVAAPN